MAAVANCPQCEHELLIPEGADEGAWSKCPTCRAFFQLRDATRREIPQLVLIDEDSATPPNLAEHKTELPGGISLEVGSESLFDSVPDDSAPSAIEPDVEESGAGKDSGGESGANVDDILARYKQDLDRFAAGLAGTMGPEKGASAGSDSLDASDEALQVPPVETPRANGSDEDPPTTPDTSFSSAETVADFPAMSAVESSDDSGAKTIPRSLMANEESEGSAPTDSTLDALDGAAPMASVGDAPEHGEMVSSGEELQDVGKTGLEDEASSESVSWIPRSEDQSDSPDRELSTVGSPTESDLAGDSQDPGPENETLAVDSLDIEIDRPTWDDPARMERLLADVEPPARDVPAEADESVDSGEGEPETAVAEDEVESDRQHDLPPIVTGAGREPRQRSPAKLMVGMAVGGVFGLGLGYFALLWLSWLFGQDNDFLGVARYLPSAILPPSYQSSQSSPPQVAANGEGQEPVESLLDGVASATGTPARDESREITASYDSPVDVPISDHDHQNFDDPIAGDNVATNAGESEPLTFETDVADPIASSVPEPMIVGAPSYSVEQLQESLDEARLAQSVLLRGDLTDPATHRPKGRSYAKLSRLAELVTFVDGDASNDSEPAKREAVALFQQTLHEPRMRSEVGYIADKWIVSRGRDIGGIFFAGKVTNRTESGSLVELQVDMGAGSPVEVVVPASIGDAHAHSTETLIVVGSIVENPAERIRGYQGNSPRVIWSDELVRLE